MGILLPENICAHRKRSIEELIKDRARDAAAQQQMLFGKPTGDHDGPEELLVKLLISFAESVSHVLMSSCEDCEVSQIPNQLRSLTLSVDQKAVDPGKRSKRPAAKIRRVRCYKRRHGGCNILNGRCTHKHDQGCQATKQVRRIQEAPHMYPTNYPSQNPLLEAYFLSISAEKITTQDAEPCALSFTSETISTQDSETCNSVSFSSKTISRSFSSKTISTQYTSSWPCSASSVRKESVQSNSLSGDLPFLSSQHPLPMLLFSEEGLPSRDLPFWSSQHPRPMLPFPQDNGDPYIQLFCQIAGDY